MAIQRRQILKQRQIREKQLKQKQALLFKERAAMLGKNETIKRAGKKDIIIAKPTVAALQKDEIEIRRNEQIIQINDGKLQQLRAGIDLNLQKRDEMILDLRTQFEKLLQNRKSMNSEFVKKIRDLQKERKAMKKAMVVKEAQNDKKINKNKDEIPTRDLGFTKKKPSSPTITKPKQITSTSQQKKKLVSTVEKPRHQNQLLTQGMIKHQIDRQVQLDYQKQVTQKILLSLRQNPNSQLYLMQKEVDALTQKLAPVMERVQKTVSNMNELNYVRHKSNSIGMVSRMAGKFMAINADKIVDLLLDQILQETALQLNNIENEMRESLDDQKSKQAAEQLLNLLNQFNHQSDEIEQKLFCGQLTKQLKQKKQKKNQRRNIKIEGIQLTQQETIYKHPFNVQQIRRSAQKVQKINEASDRTIDDGQISLDDTADVNNELANMKYRNKQEINYQEEAIPIQKDIRVSHLNEEHFKSIQSGMLRYSQYVIRANGCDNEQVWKFYDHICDDLFSQLFTQTVKMAQGDIELALEGMIAQEILAVKK